MAVVVSLINMKGGVGKTTVASQLAHEADIDGLRVLAVDLDPQSNLSHSILGAAKYVEHVRANGPTVVQILEDYVPPSGSQGGPQRINVNEVILQGVGYGRHSQLDLIASRLELSRTLKNPTGKERMQRRQPLSRRCRMSPTNTVGESSTTRYPILDLLPRQRETGYRWRRPKKLTGIGRPDLGD